MKLNKEMEVKQQVLEMLKDLMMGNSASKFKPVSAEVVMAKPEESLKDHLAKASEDAPEEMVDCDMDKEEDEEDMKPKGLRAFMGRK